MPVMIFCVFLMHTIALWALLFVGSMALGSLHGDSIGPSYSFLRDSFKLKLRVMNSQKQQSKNIISAPE
ncbi:hypothetical protein KO02_01415 [Sphingobacterium sp. ML3W]|nr:hypothetical protein KO02_01415 [Sphingobacterium sp. ML3W]